jgi:hypothetical protein
MARRGQVNVTLSNVVGRWFFWVMWYDSGTMYLQADNGTAQSFSVTQTATSSGSLYIGRYPGSGAYFNGLVDEVNYWNVALTSTQRTNLYTAQNAGTGSYPFIGIP